MPSPNGARFIFNIEQVSEYIARQEEHHRHKSFQDEFRALLRRHRLEWDEQYVWD